MGSKIKLLLVPAISIIVLAGCNIGKHYTKINEILENSRIFEVNYDRVDYDIGDKFWKDNNDNWGGGCTAVTKEFSNGHRVIGRNMDLNISKKPAYIVRTKASEGRYKTVGLAYTYRDYAPFYDDVKKNGIEDEFKNILPFLCDDVMNDQGLHIEVNMRHAETDFSGNDKFSLKGTNPNGSRRVHMFELPRYIAENCKTVEEAKEYIKTLDIYSKSKYWNYCFIVSDSSKQGETHSSLLEFSEIGNLGLVWNNLVDQGALKYEEKVSTVNWIDEEDINKINWIGRGPLNDEYYYKVYALAQANFYVNWWAYEREDIRSGEGRFLTIQSLIESIDDMGGMYDLMRRISYSWFYEKYNECSKYHFDPRSEYIGEFQDATYEFLYNPVYKDDIPVLFDAINEDFRNMTREEKEVNGTLWESTFTEVIDLTDQIIQIRFFENEDLRFNITFDGIQHLSALPDPVYDEIPPLTKVYKN